MPIAKIVAPTNSASPSPPAVGFGVLPKSPDPVPTISAINVAAVPSSSVCARSPWPFPTAISWRQAEVNPKREWKSATPSSRPRMSRTPNFAPCAAQTYQVSPTARAPATASGTTLTGSSGCGTGAAQEVGKSRSFFSPAWVSVVATRTPGRSAGWGTSNVRTGDHPDAARPTLCDERRRAHGRMAAVAKVPCYLVLFTQTVDGGVE